MPKEVAVKTKLKVHHKLQIGLYIFSALAAGTAIILAFIYS